MFHVYSQNAGNKAKQLKSVVFPLIGIQTVNSSIKRKPDRDVSSGQAFNKILTLRRLGNMVTGWNIVITRN